MNRPLRLETKGMRIHPIISAGDSQEALDRRRQLAAMRSDDAPPVFTARQVEAFGRYLLGLSDCPEGEIERIARGAFSAWVVFGPENQP